MITIVNESDLELVFNQRKITNNVAVYKGKYKKNNYVYFPMRNLEEILRQIHILKYTIIVSKRELRKY